MHQRVMMLTYIHRTRPWDCSAGVHVQKSALVGHLQSVRHALFHQHPPQRISKRMRLIVDLVCRGGQVGGERALELFVGQVIVYRKWQVGRRRR